MICYAFPLAHEAAPLLKLCTQRESFCIDQLPCTLGNLGDRRVLIALVGMGQAAAARHTELLLRYFRPEAFILAGYGGALIPALKVGQVLVSTNYSSSDVLPFVRLLSDFDFVTFTTTDKIVGTPAERDRLARGRKGQVVEMESEAVAELVQPREIPFVAVRAISDDHAHVLPVRALAAAFDAPRARATPFRLFLHLATHWGDIAPFTRFVRNLSKARRNLTLFLQQLNNEMPRR